MVFWIYYIKTHKLYMFVLIFSKRTSREFKLIARLVAHPFNPQTLEAGGSLCICELGLHSDSSTARAIQRDCLRER